MILRALLLLVGWLVGAGLPAQELQWVPYRLPVALHELRPRLLHEGPEGLLYLGTSAGLYTFDGRSFTPLPHRENTDPVDVSTLFHDRAGTLWVGNADGTVDHLVQQQLEPWQPEEGLPAVPITGITEDTAGQHWLATYGEGVYVWSGSRLYNFDTDDGLPANDVYTLIAQPDGTVWLGTDTGLTICAFRNGRKSVTTLTRADGLPDEIVRTLLADGQGNGWIGTHDRGVVHYDRSTGLFHTPLPDWPHGPVTTLTLVDDRTLTIATENHRAWQLDLITSDLRPVGDETLQVEHLLQDVEGGLWLLTARQGLFRADQHVAFVPAGQREVQTVYASSEGTLWAGTDRGLFRVTDSGAWLPHPAGADLNIISLYEDGYGYLWLGTFGEGAYLLDPRTGRRRHLGRREGLLDGSILSIDGQDDRLWLASLGGVTELSLREDPFLTTSLEPRKVDGLRTDFIYQVFAEAAGRVWLATDGEGLARLQDGKVSHLQDARTATGDTLDLRRVYSITATAPGRLWVNAARGGLFAVAEGGPARHWETPLPGEAITGLAPLSADRLLVAHTEGLALLHLAGGRFQPVWTDRSGNNPYRPILNSGTTDSLDRVWIGGSGGLLRYRTLPRASVDRPRIRLRSVSVYPDGPARPRGTRFAAGQNTLAFDFVGLWYTHPERVRCRYQLEGYDPGWIETRNQQVIYSKLPPGAYTFRVAATIGDDWRSADLTTYAFTIAPPIWQRWWFLLLSALLLTGGVGYLLRGRDRRLRREGELRQQRVRSQYEALKSQINPHFLFNSFNTLVAMIEESPEDAVTYTERLSDLFRSILSYRDQETISLREELTLLDNYLFLLDKRFGRKLTVIREVEGASGAIVPLSLQLLVENAIKHNVVSTQRPLVVRVALSADRQHLCVHNPLQPKLQAEPSTGFGLQSLAERYALLTRKPLIVEHTEQAFRICLPLLPANPRSEKSTS